KMAEGTDPDPTIIDDQLVPIKARLSIGKSNLLMDLQRNLDVDLLRSALGITLNDPAYPFMAPSAGDLVID
nr:hypothetical protein [Tanacetum cinerariifolium]